MNKPLCPQHQTPNDHCAVLHRTAASSAIALKIGHEVAAKLSYWNGPPYNVPEIVDAELQEVREVLMNLRQSSPDCWCIAQWEGAHDGRCLRTRALMERLAQRGESK